MSPLKRPKEAAQILSVSERRLSRWRLEGGGPAFVRLGHRSVAYAESALADFIAKNSRQSTGEVAVCP